MKRISVFLILLLIICTSGYALEISDVNGFDRLFMKPYSRDLDIAGTALQLAAMATPIVLVNSICKGDIPILGTMYAETIGLAFGLKEVGKALISRSRPCAYFNPVPDLGTDLFKSFPSGHATIAFAAASFTSYAFCKYNSHSKMKVPVILGSYALAVATSILRIESGNHFMTDIIAGALLGTAVGFVIPMIHHSGKLTASPFSFLVKFDL